MKIGHVTKAMPPFDPNIKFRRNPFHHPTYRNAGLLSILVAKLAIRMRYHVTRIWVLKFHDLNNNNNVIVIQRFNAILLRNSFEAADHVG